MSRNRLFAFGCSFTCYKWPTWADILGKTFDQYFNYGRAGAGNQYIFNSIIEASLTHKIQSDDTVIVMWTSVTREDRYVNRKWITPGSIYHQTVYDKKFVKKFADVRGYVIRDLSLIHSIDAVLNSVGCSRYFLSMVDILNPNCFEDQKGKFVDELIDLQTYFQTTIEQIRPSVHATVFNYNWNTRSKHAQDRSFRDAKQNYEQCAGPGWPSWENFISGQTENIDASILREINDISRWDWQGMMIDGGKRPDLHPLPSEHLEYIEKVLPELVVDQSIKNWVSLVDDHVVSNRIDQDPGADATAWPRDLWHLVEPLRW